MPLPVANRPSDVPANVCCDTLWLMGERIREVALAAVCSCSITSCQNLPLRSWQTEGPRSGSSIQGNSLVVSHSRSRLASDATTRRGGARPIPITRAEFLVELREIGWPHIREHEGTQTIEVPDPEMIHALARHARGHAEKMWRALLDGAAHTSPARQLFPASTNPHVVNRGVNVGELSYPGPSGPIITYAILVTVDHVLP